MNGKRKQNNVMKQNKTMKNHNATKKNKTMKNHNTTKNHKTMKKKTRKWSLKYKRSINCNNPLGFSQRQHCKYGRK